MKAGQLVAELDPTLLEVQVSVAKANIAQREGDIASQKVQLADTQKTLERTQALYDKNLVPKQQLEQAELAVKTRQASIDSTASQLVSAKAQLDQAELNVKYCKIYSPIDGVVVDRLVDKGMTVQASMTTPQFFKIATDLTKLKLSAGVDEAEIGKVRMGQEVDFTVDSYGGQQFLGTVSAVRLNATTNQNVVTYPVWIDVQNNDLKLRPSMTASATIIVSRVDDVIRVPNTATRFRPNAEIYTALGITPPAAGQGGRLAGGTGRGANGPGGNAPGAAPDAVDPQAAGASRPGGGGAGAASKAPTNTTAANSGGQAQAPGATLGTPGQGGGNGNRQRNNNQGGQNSQQTGQIRQPGSSGFGGGGFGRGMSPTLTPEDRARLSQQLQQQYGGQMNRNGRNGRGGAGNNTGNNAFNQNGRGGGRGGANRQPANAAGDTTPMTERNADKIDELFAPLQTQETRGQVWVYDEKATNEKDKLKNIPVHLGVTDGTFTQLLSGDLTVGQQVVTGVILPIKATPGMSNNPLLQQQNQMRGMGGMQPGGNPGGGRGGGGGGRGGGN